MTQIVKFFENDVVYKEGPFVVGSCGGKYRVEVELVGHICPVLCHNSVYSLIRTKFGYTGRDSLEFVSKIVDWLNYVTELGYIVKSTDGEWKVKNLGDKRIYKE